MANVPQLGAPGGDDDSQEMPTCEGCGQAIFFEHAEDCPKIQRAHDCAICRGQGTTFAHWAWHDVCRAELNPVALIQFIDSGPQLMAVRRIREYIIGVTGMDTRAAYAALARESASAADAVDPQATSTGKPPTRDVNS